MDAVGMLLNGYDPGSELVQGRYPNATESFVVLSVNGSPRLLLPHDKAIMQPAVLSFTGRRRFAFLLPPFVQFASKVGGPLSSLCSYYSLISGNSQIAPLKKLLTEVLEHEDCHIALRLSFNRPNAKIVAIAVSSDGHELCFAKFGMESMTNELVSHESSVLRHLENTAVPIVIPQSLYDGTWADRNQVLITAPLNLQSLGKNTDKAHLAVDSFAKMTARGRYPLRESQYWHDVLDRVKQPPALDTNDEVLINAVTRINNTWGDLHFDFGASHGDWSRANVGLVDGRVAALDWERFTDFAPRGIDTAHFFLLENTFRLFRKSIDIEMAVGELKSFQRHTGSPTNTAEPLVVLALLEMVLRFRSAKKVGIKSVDSKFGKGLQTSIQKWAA